MQIAFINLDVFKAVTIKMLCFLTFMAPFTAISAQSDQWTTVTSPTIQKLYGVAYRDSGIVVAVGDGGTIIRSIDGGSHWENIISPATDALRAVTFHGNTGLAVGISGTVIRSENSGLNWSLQDRITHRDLFSVSMNGDMAVMTGHEGYIFRSKDGGQSWEFKNSGTFDNLFGVSVSGINGISVGGQGAVAMTVDTARAFGLTVLGQNPLDLLSFSAVSMANDTLGWVVGYLQSSGGIVVKTEDAGFVWKKVEVDTTHALGFLMGVSALSPDVCTIVGSEGKIYYTGDRGKTWNEQLTDVTSTLNAVATLSGTKGIAVGDGGTVLKLISGTVTAIQDINNAPVGQQNIILKQNFPNPFKDITTINYSVARPGLISVKVFNSTGTEVATLIDCRMVPGDYSVSWSAAGSAAGVYYYQLSAANQRETKKMILMK